MPAELDLMNNNNIKSEITDFYRLMAPFSLTRLIGVGAEFSASLMLAKLGANYLAASGLISVSASVLVTTGCCSLYATGDLASRAKTKQDPNTGQVTAGNDYSLGQILNVSYLCAGLYGMAIASILCFSSAILTSFGQPKAVADIVQDYFRGAAVGIPALLLSVSSQQMAYAINQKSLVLAVNIARRIIFLSLAYTLINGKFGCPQLGARGHGIASATSAWFDQLALMLYFKCNRSLSQQYGLFQHNLSSSFVHLPGFLSKTSRLWAQALNEFTANYVSTLLIGLKGEHALAAIETVNQFANLVKTLNLSAGQSASILVGSANSSEKQKRVGNAALLSSAIIPLCAVSFITLPKLLTSLFTKQSEVISIAEQLFKPAAAYVTFDTVRSVSSGALRGLQDYNFSILANFTCLTLIGLTLGYALSFHTSMGPLGITVAAASGMALTAVLTLGHWCQLSKQKVNDSEQLFNCAISDSEARSEAPSETSETLAFFAQQGTSSSAVLERA